MKTKISVATLMLLGLVLSACTADAGDPDPGITTPPPATVDPTEEPTVTTRPDVSELILALSGLNSLEIKAVPQHDTATALLTLQRTCSIDGDSYPIFDTSYFLASGYDSFYEQNRPAHPFLVDADLDGEIVRIDLVTSIIATEHGIRIGDPADSVASKLARANIVYEDFDQQAGLTKLYVVQGNGNQLTYEVATNENYPDYWTAEETDRVFSIRLEPSGMGFYSVAATGNVPGICYSDNEL